LHQLHKLHATKPIYVLPGWTSIILSIITAILFHYVKVSAKKRWYPHLLSAAAFSHC
jgi:hypothetical protein